MKPITWTKEKTDAALVPYREARKIGGADIFLASLILHAKRIPGMCSDEKIIALDEICGEIDRGGDVVEIGTWWGKSAFVLLMLARRYEIGNVLCVDPWTDTDLVQGVPDVDEASASLSAEDAFEVFKMSLLPYCTPRSSLSLTKSDINYLRLRSADARKSYRINSSVVVSPEFGTTEYEHRIALIHIDGNHAYDKVKQDVELWTPLVLPGGWVVINDYDWRFGDGPKRAADELIVATVSQIAKYFVAGGAMFIKFKNA